MTHGTKLDPIHTGDKQTQSQANWYAERKDDPEFKKKNPDVYFVSINASKQKDHEFIVKYKLNNTPTYVLINSNGEKIGRRVGTFYPKYFEGKIS